MEQRDLELIERHITTDTNLKKLYEEHLDLEKKIEQINQKLTLTPAEEMEKKNLKKVKLRGRDQIEFILKQYRDRNQ